MKKTSTVLMLGLATAALATGAGLRGATHTSAGFEWDQKNTPDEFRLLGEGEEYGGASFGEEVPNGSTSQVKFPDEQERFDTSRCLGTATVKRRAGSALNLPRGNEGGRLRHGVELSWSKNRALPNLRGADIVVYETGTAGTDSGSGPDGFMVRVRRVGAGLWTDWYFKSVDQTSIYRPHNKSALFAYGIDLTAMGVVPGASIDRIQIANLTASDRINSRGRDVAVGFVLPDVGGDSFARPDPGFEGIKTLDDNNLFDPDILYVACRHNLIRKPASAPD